MTALPHPACPASSASNWYCPRQQLGQSAFIPSVVSIGQYSHMFIGSDVVMKRMMVMMIMMTVIVMLLLLLIMVNMGG